MNINQDFKCFIGLHKYEVIKEENIMNQYYRFAHNESINRYIIGKAIISRCVNCGKIKVTYVSLTNTI